jgi:UDP-N-acetylmuramoylalanine--D-glutamate ligase
MKTFEGQSILIIGAARQGLALARFLARQGARVTLNDKKSVSEMKAAMDSLASYPLTWALGHHDPKLLKGMDLVCVSGGVPLDLTLIEQARQQGIPLSNDSQIFMELVPCRVIGITGSAGKTTTTTLLGRMAQHAVKSPARAWVGGNIGRPLIDMVDQIQPEDTVVLEFSSFQLELMTLSPQICAILNITPNHLDRHGTLDAYAKIKSRIFEYQGSDDWTVLGYDDPTAWQFSKQVNGKLAAFSLQKLPDGLPGSYCQEGQLFLFDGKHSTRIMSQDLIELRGQHNLLNVLAACALAQAAGFEPDAMLEGVRGFTGVPHRLEFIRSYRGSDWYNDSKATTPEGCIASVQSFDEPVVLLLGGRDKHLPWDRLAQLVHSRVDHVIVFGEAADKILGALGPLTSGQKPLSLDHCQSLKDAVDIAAAIAEQGDVVLLSPGCTSFDEFDNFEQRGELFKEWVKQLS